MMKRLLAKTLIVASLTVCSGAAQSEEWTAFEGTKPQGLDTASMWVSKHEFGLEFSCDAKDGPKQQLNAKFLGPALPRLYGEDGDTAELSFLFTDRHGARLRIPWEPYYFDGGLGDQAWLGPVRFDQSALDALARAVELEIQNEDRERVYAFGTKGTFAAAAIVRRVCGFTS